MLSSLGESAQFIIQLIVVLGCLFYGAKKGGMALGILGGIGLIILVFGFNLQPGKPATDVILTILAVVVASATLQASGGLDVMLQISEKVLRNNPKHICILAPVIGWILTILCGTGHTVYTLLPIIYDIAIKSGVRPERPLAATTVSSQLAVIASPVSVVGVSMVTIILNRGVIIDGFTSYVDLIKLTIPATLIGVFAIGFWSMFRGKDLDKDEEFQEKIKNSDLKKYIYGETATVLDKKLPTINWVCMWIFLAAIAIVALVGYFDELRPAWPNAKGVMKPLGMTPVIQIFMLLAAAIIMIVSGIKSSKISKNEIFQSGMIALVAIYGISWMADTMFKAHMDLLTATLGEWLKAFPWAYIIIGILISKFLNSQAASVATFVPLALSIGVDPGIVIAFAAANYGYYILPTYPSDLAAIQFDRSGTTKIGKYVINHSFILPGLIGVFTACVAGYVLAKMYGYL
ncbi:anaerobic C4-dicarboxylate transporter [Campylobacter sputorum]|uniref:anaerobic C4-dicarboxylate transporter n=1 Tax=Campylobacter sputorum TaxID=206 RepID=UPI001245C848|nr:anaerobic C4-dicarboxylate transporter [Campylobacter sputorum]KAB0581910.1 anaerobic C4-dicarboxylate transporter [Campylobacter sputorum subsp. sputorum]